MSIEYPHRTKLGVVALLLSGCSVNGIASRTSISRATVAKWQKRLPEMVAAAGGEERVLQEFLDPALAQEIKDRTAGGPPEHRAKVEEERRRWMEQFRMVHGHYPFE